MRAAAQWPARLAHPVVALAPRPSIRSNAELTLPSWLLIRRTTTIRQGMAQKSSHTQRIPAPICWSANGGRVTPGMWS